MEEAELKKILELKGKIQEHLSLIEKIIKSKDEEGSKVNSNDIAKEIHVERGRLIKFYKSNKRYIDELYEKYDLFIIINDILDREENDNYTRSDKINDIKQAAIANQYSQFENSILKVVNDNLDDLNSMKSKLRELDTNGGIKALSDIKKTYSEQLKEHRENIDSRYKNEFIHKKATIPSLVTMLPKAVGLAAKKVAVCIDERKEAKTNKEKFNKLGKVLQSIGQLIVTPVIYSGKFVIDHWYLLLLLLLWFPNLFPSLKGKGKGNDKSDDMEPQHQEQEAYEPVGEPAKEHVGEHAGEPLIEPAGTPIVEPVGKHIGEPVGRPIVEPVGTPMVEPVDEPVVRPKAEPVVEETTHIERKPAIDYASDPRFISNSNIVNETVGDSNAVANENVFSVSQQKDFLYKLAEKSFSSDVNGNSYQVYKNVDDYILSEFGELDASELEEVKNNLYNSEFGTSIRFIVDDKLGYFNSEQDFINAMTNNRGLVDINLEKQTMQDFISGLEPVGNTENLVGTEFDTEGLSVIGTDLLNKFSAEYGAAGVAAFILYEAIQYGLAIPTNGLSLLAPG